ncbi:glycosyltransferase family 2 protein [Modestobacter sp. VKM Ac-2983]|uniref:glycosyltransferase n=1 Tax=Modestobacter sp. VKM Ac-2983 TaxID=3004137 RepID=UPI0022AB922F|nr:glycosyltransferase family 2 protein [Modestobacter sp. VKM Ac-2983]MCZ2807208.1 glycosyltransferase family 2 protein [Modestobacter sp. VKM Ac-2983]
MTAAWRRLLRVCAGLSVAAAVHAALNSRLLRRPPAVPRPVSRRVTVVVPARDEAHQITGCLAAVLDQRGVPHLQVVVVDDGSTDGTADRVTAVGDDRVTLLPATPPGPGWLGKPNACAQGADALDGAAPDDVLVFLDADVRLMPDAIASAVAVLDESALDLVSPWPRQLTGSAAERLVQPLQQWLWATLLPLRLAERSPRPSLAAANGQFLVVRRAAYDRAGGHAAVRGEVIEDVALLRAVKAAGGRGVVVDGSTLAACRMYDGWTGVRDGYTKSLWSAVGGHPAAAAGVAAGLSAVWLLPPLAALTGSRAGLVGYAAGVANRAVVATRTGGRVWPDALAHPVSIVLLDVLVARSVAGHRKGSLRWRGRTLPSAAVDRRPTSRAPSVG